jgi:uncharacterized membrane protein YfcA
VSATGSLASYHIGTHVFEITLLKLVIGILIICFSFLEILPRFQSITISRPLLPIGGVVSGFFGGLSGHQGALRSAFLIKAGLSKQAFLGTRVVIACLVDLTRISVYAAVFGAAWHTADPGLIIAATLAAFSGAWLGNKWVKKMELKTLNVIVNVCLVAFGIALCLGLI